MEETDITVCPAEEPSAAGTEAQTAEKCGDGGAAGTAESEPAAVEPPAVSEAAEAAPDGAAIAVAEAGGSPEAAPESDAADMAAEEAPAAPSVVEGGASGVNAEPAADAAGEAETVAAAEGDACGDAEAAAGAPPAVSDAAEAAPDGDAIAVAEAGGSPEAAPESDAADTAAEEAPASPSVVEGGARGVNAEPAADAAGEAEASADADASGDEPQADSTADEAVIQIVVEAAVEPVSGDLLPQLVEAAPDEAAAEYAAIKAVIEGIVYITEEPVTIAQIANALEQPEAKIQEIVDEIIAEFDAPQHGLAVREIAGGYKMTTKPEHHEAIRNFVRSLKPPLKLSLAALETLATIAYKQPITAPEIMEIRGVQGTGVLKTLIDRKLIMTAGRKNVVGRPMLYKTTREFLVQFGLRDLSELPSLKEFEELKRLAFNDGDVTPAEAPAAEPEGADTGDAEMDAVEPEQHESTPEPAAEAAEGKDGEPEGGEGGSVEAGAPEPEPAAAGGFVGRSPWTAPDPQVRQAEPGGSARVTEQPETAPTAEAADSENGSPENGQHE